MMALIWGIVTRRAPQRCHVLLTPRAGWPHETWVELREVLAREVVEFGLNESGVSAYGDLLESLVAALNNEEDAAGSSATG